MRDRTFYWTAGRVRKNLHVRYWWDGFGYAIRQLLWCIRNRLGRRYVADFEIPSTDRRSNGHCYCPSGWSTQASFKLLGLGLIVWYHRDPTPRPCVCDRVMWLAMPDDHADEIEEYGAERLYAEFPDLAPKVVPA